MRIDNGAYKLHIFSPKIQLIMNDSYIPYDRVFDLHMPKSQEEQQEIDLFNKFLSHICIKSTDNYITPPPVIIINGIAVATEGNFSASVGKPKSRKTFNVSALTATMLSGKEILGYKANMPKGKTRILYVDTEQSRVHCKKVLDRIIELAEITPEDADKRIKFILLREFNPQERRNIINKALATDPTIGFVVIDGIRDLITDINSPSESVDIINDLMRWTQVYDIHIHTVLHLNKQDDQIRGHIGTELSNKAETVLKVVRNKENTDISEVHPMVTRDQEFESFAFRINEKGLPELIEGFSFAKEDVMTLDRITVDQHKSALDAVFSDNKILAYGELVKTLQQEYAAIGYRRGKTSIVTLLKQLRNSGIIECNNKKYKYNIDNLKHIKS
jgi:hypothetical protein